MNKKSDVLTVTYDYSDMKDVPALCVARHTGDTIEILKIVQGDQADILYRLLTEQIVNATIEPDKEITDEHE